MGEWYCSDLFYLPHLKTNLLDDKETGQLAALMSWSWHKNLTWTEYLRQQKFVLSLVWTWKSGIKEKIALHKSLKGGPSCPFPASDIADNFDIHKLDSSLPSPCFYHHVEMCVLGIFTPVFIKTLPFMWILPTINQYELLGYTCTDPNCKTKYLCC